MTRPTDIVVICYPWANSLGGNLQLNCHSLGLELQKIEQKVKEIWIGFAQKSLAFNPRNLCFRLKQDGRLTESLES